jgi:alkanesulfonate monooxygenase SsuD/methylene tetrahydromethanopterin reductase-like flavin-dependent oxidoreductase (luciferase family)
MVRGQRGLLPPPVGDIEHIWSPAEKAQAQQMLSCSFVGSAATVREKLDEFVQRTTADELMVSMAMYDHPARVRSLELLAQLASET